MFENQEIKRIDLPLTAETVHELRAGDRVRLFGKLYTARDAAHKRLVELLQKGQQLPVDLQGQTLYYVGPSPAKPGYVTGSAGPTSSYRMDSMTVPLLKLGLRGMIGKGVRSREVTEAMQQYGAVYFCAVGGAAALIARSIKKSELVTYEDLGPEAIYCLTVEDFPAIVAIDAQGNDLYQTGPEDWRRGRE